VLLRFESLFGNGVHQLPPNAVIHSAKLLLHTPKNSTTTDFDSNDAFRCHRMIMDWNDDSITWSSSGNGVSADNVKAANAPSFSVVPDVDGGPAIFDVTGDLELFKSGTTNRGWVIRASSGGAGDGWTFRSSESPDITLRPTLEIVYSSPGTSFASWALAQGLTGPNNSPEADPDGDGASNLTEFAYNLNPLTTDATAVTQTGTNGLPVARYLPSGMLEVEWVRRKASTVTGLTYLVQFGQDLATWSPGQSPSVINLNAEWERVILRDAVPGPNSVRFARVLLTLQP
jgi:hypothetical protein